MFKSNQAFLEEFMQALADASRTAPVRPKLKELENKFELEDMDQILALFYKVNRAKLKNADKPDAPYVPKTTSTSKMFNNPGEVSEKQYTEEEVKKIFKTETKEETIRNHTKRELTDMYISLTGSKLLTRSDKSDVYNAIQGIFNAQQRGEAMYRHFFMSSKEKTK
ncbi:hypothetical protein [Candidatus Enterococcus ferrettii]|uniref:Uncharacterized protein n=1 Tax=Candidatus Enterococcus ferrettii TaxID=2815324 RepID=A0ABV0EVN2_9ENTE|nr:hypothetical protein [Enterococcus sp. 665A]MBO1342534.1 hypothetical protein [Enterococcus sp. 665A]